MSLNDKARTEHGRQCCGGEVTLLLEPLAVVPSVAVFGVGHVGLELARILCRHDLELHLVDSRADQLTAERLACLDDGQATVHVHHSPVPEVVLGQVPRGTHVLVLTHDHAEDFALCDAALRCAHLGLDRADRVVGEVAPVPEGAARSRATTTRRSPGSSRRSATPTWPARTPRRSRSASPPSWSRTFQADRGRGPAVTIFRARVLDTPDDPFAGGAAAQRRRRRAAGRRRGRPRSAATSRRCARPTPTRRSSTSARGCCCPGFVDTHVHFPQVRVIGALGMPLLEWLERCALPEECHLAEPAYAQQVAAEFLFGLTSAGTTTALVFGSHFAPAVDLLFTEAARVGLRVTSGLVVSDRGLPEALLTTPERAYDEAIAPGRALARLRPRAVRRDPAVLLQRRRRAARRLCVGGSRTCRTRGSPPT